MSLPSAGAHAGPDRTDCRHSGTRPSSELSSLDSNVLDRPSCARRRRRDPQRTPGQVAHFGEHLIGGHPEQSACVSNYFVRAVSLVSYQLIGHCGRWEKRSRRHATRARRRGWGRCEGSGPISATDVVAGRFPYSRCRRWQQGNFPCSGERKVPLLSRLRLSSLVEIAVSRSQWLLTSPGWRARRESSEYVR